MIDTIIRILLGLSSAPLYYILVLLQLTILTPFLIKAIQVNHGVRLLFLVTPIYIYIYILFVFLYSNF